MDTKQINNRQYIGKLGEQKAGEYLIKNKYRLIDKNFLCKFGEIDIIAKSPSNELVFIEVKTRKSLKYGSPCDAVTPHKIKNILLTSKYYIYINKFNNIDIRYDVIEVYLNNREIAINHIKNII